MKKFKYGIIGCGGICTTKHLSSITQLKDKIEVVAFCDIDEAKAQRAKVLFDFPNAQITTNYKDLLAIAEIEVVLVLTPNRSHSFISVDALEAGKHVLCEKPMAINAVEAKKMLDAAERTGKVLSVAYQNRFRPECLALKDICEAGDLGDIYYAKAHALRRKAVPTWGVFLNEEEQGGGPLIDIGTHALDLTLWTMDNFEPQMVVGSVYNKLTNCPGGNIFGAWNPDEFTVEDSAFGFIKMKNGATIQLESSWALNVREYAEAATTLCGTVGGADMKGGLFINSDNHNKLTVTEIDTDGGGVPFFEGASNDAEVIEALSFLHAVENGKEHLVTKPEQAFAVTQILEAIYESAKTGEPVYFD